MNSKFITPLIIAIKKGNYEITKLLVQSGPIWDLDSLRLMGATIGATIEL